MELEWAVQQDVTDAYDFEITHAEAFVFDWEPMLLQILRDRQRGESPGLMAARFHNTLAQVAVEFARLAGQHQVVLSGGCFQNKILLERIVLRLREAGFDPCWHQRVPPNDGGVALGQVVAASWMLPGGADRGLASSNRNPTNAEEFSHVSGHTR